MEFNLLIKFMDNSKGEQPRMIPRVTEPRLGELGNLWRNGKKKKKHTNFSHSSTYSFKVSNAKYKFLLSCASVCELPFSVVSPASQSSTFLFFLFYFFIYILSELLVCIKQGKSCRTISRTLFFLFSLSSGFLRFRHASDNTSKFYC